MAAQRLRLRQLENENSRLAQSMLKERELNSALAESLTKAEAAVAAAPTLEAALEAGAAPGVAPGAGAAPGCRAWTPPPRRCVPS